MTKAKEILKIIVEEIDKEAVKKAVMAAASKIHDEPDEKIIDDMISNAMEKVKDKSGGTDDVIQMVIHMLRG